MRPGDEVVVLPYGTTTTVTAIDSFDGELDEAFPPMSVTLRLADDIDISRGDLICHPDDRPTLEREVTAEVCWMADAPLRPRGRLQLKHNTHSVAAVVDELVDAVDIHTLDRRAAPDELGLNEIGRVRLRTARPVAFDPYARNRATGLVHPHRPGHERDGRGGHDRAGAGRRLTGRAAVGPPPARADPQPARRKLPRRRHPGGRGVSEGRLGVVP